MQSLLESGLNDALRIAGLLFTLVRDRTRLFKEIHSALEIAYGGENHIFDNYIPCGVAASQLFEMLPMNEFEREEISPDMTVKQIREKKAENRAAKEPSEALVETFLKGRDIDLDDYETISELKKF